MAQEGLVRRVYDVSGTVQGVGFRPAVYRLAVDAGLGGWVQNCRGSVRLCLDGPLRAVESFVDGLPARVPPNARIDRVQVLESRWIDAALAAGSFTIAPSLSGDRLDLAVPADLAVCARCATDVRDPANRRHAYAFTTCTACGPRYTVIESMPYDRARTTLSAFPLCDACRREYEDPVNRRFHAESIACPECGPRLFLRSMDGREVPGDPLRNARAELSRGAILAVRGIGGFLLAVDAFNRGALERLRARKCRPHQPFAVMARDEPVVRRFCAVPDAAAGLLRSPRAPIVILDVRSEAVGLGLPIDLLSPDTALLGVMLPTSPLQQLLFDPLPGDPVSPFDLLVMTSGNRRGEPTCTRNEEAQARLQGVADLMLGHNREISLRNDDSLCVIRGGLPQVWRRARGYAPEAMRLSLSLRRCVLAMGAEIKNTIAVGFDRQVVLSPHVGDLETPEALDGLAQVVSALPRFLDRVPEVVAVDLHPDMHSTVLGRRLARDEGLPVEPVQHHHAHAMACLAEHGRTSGLALTLDGTGLGPDGTIWGAELLDLKPGGFRRLATFSSVPLPGGDASVREPVRQAVARWAAIGERIDPRWLIRLGITGDQAEAWSEQARSKTNTAESHAAGRLFDAFAVLLGASPRTITYEGQPAIRLEALARQHLGASARVPFSVRETDGLLQIDWGDAFRELADPSRVAGRESAWAMGFHEAVVDAAVRMVEYGLSNAGHTTVALSGGVFMNVILSGLLVGELERRRVEVMVHRQTPPNDGCIAFGQAVVAGLLGEP